MMNTFLDIKNLINMTHVQYKYLSTGGEATDIRQHEKSMSSAEGTIF